MRLVLRFLVLLALLLGASAAQAVAEKPKPSSELPMKVVIVRSSEPACEPICPEWIMAEGMITSETPVLFAKLFQQLGERKLPIIIHSPGGSIIAAIQIGYIIRARKLDVAVGRTNYEGCEPFGRKCTAGGGDTGHYRGRVVSHKAYCLSACPLILASGSARLAGIDAVVGVHKWQFDAMPGTSPKKQSSKKSKPDPGWDGVVRRMITDFLDKMGNSAALVGDMEKAPFTSINLLDMKRRQKLDLITRPEGAQALTDQKLCAAFPPAGHCMVGGGEGARSYADALGLAGIKPSDKAMTVAIVRNAAPDCEPFCPQWIAAEGVITPATPKLFAKVVKSAGKAKLPVVINSPGGDLDAALEMARLIRKQSLDVAVAAMAYEGCKPDDKACKRPSAKAPYKGVPAQSGQRCNGVCTIILAAGKGRYVDGDGVVVIHNPDTYPSRSSGKTSAGLMKAVLGEGDLSDRLLTEMTRLAYGTPRSLPGEELARIGLATSSTSPETWLKPESCRADRPPAFCVKRK